MSESAWVTVGQCFALGTAIALVCLLEWLGISLGRERGRG